MRANRRRRTAGVVVAVSVALIVAACGDDDDDDDAEATAAATQPTAAPTTQGESSSTTEPASTEAPEIPTDHVCPHVPNVVLVQNPDGPEPDLPGNVEPLEPAQLTELLGYEDFPGIEVEDELREMFAASAITPYRVTDDGDSLEIAVQIEADNADLIEPDDDSNVVELDDSGPAGLVAAPLLLLTLTGHWTLAPGDDPAAITASPPTPPDVAFASEGTVAVVDTGYTTGNGEIPTTEWLDARVQGVDQSFDAELTNIEHAGHGKFVASIITQEAPNVEVRVARLGAIDPSVVPDDLENNFTTDELQLYIAIKRLLQLDLPYSALNLSLGAYACEELGDPAVANSGLAIREAVELWFSSLGGEPLPLLAAVGNHDPNDSSPLPPFLPAAYDTNPNGPIYAVESVNAAGNTSGFSNPGPLDPGGVSVAVGGLGERLIGIGVDNDWVYWSGTSFATALMTAEAVLNGGVPPSSYPVPDSVEAEPPPTSTTPPTTIGSNTVTTTTRPPTSVTTTTLG